MIKDNRQGTHSLWGFLCVEDFLIVHFMFLKKVDIVLLDLKNIAIKHLLGDCSSLGIEKHNQH